jgi:adenosylhomocysteine nucleosidase
VHDGAPEGGVVSVLFVAALPEETAALPPDLAVLHVGVGKVQAAATLARHLATVGDDVDLVVNLGTAGGLHRQRIGDIVEVARVHQHDFDQHGVSRFVGRELPGGPLALPGPPDATGRLATGDRVILDPADRERLARDADVVDMEGYAIAAVAAAFGVDAWITKAVSDAADSDAVVTWREALARCAAALAGWVEQRGLR